jgi:moderate conductance mechanosensitive channel
MILDILTDWMLQHGLKIAGIIIGGFILRKFSYVIIEKTIRKAVKGSKMLSHEAERKREDTLIGIFHQIFKITILVLAILMILSEVGVDIGPLIAGAGILGLAFGFGGQYLIKDLIAGFFIILENQYRVGDVVCLDDKCGLVENINVRTTILRDMDGTVHHVPNGEITTASNLSKEYSRVNLDIGISYDANLEKVIQVVNKVGKDLAQDPEWEKSISKPPQFLRVNDFADSSVIIKILGDTKPLKQWEVTGELRKRLKIAFDKNSIEIPFPQRVVHHKE